MSAQAYDASTLGALALSVSSSVSIVIVNKYLISSLGYRYVTFLTSIHLLVTAVFLRLAARAGWLEPKAIERRALLQFSVVNGVSIGFLNLSLGYNSVGFYQMTKLAIIPCTVAIQQTFYQKQARSIHWFPYDRAGEVDADPQGLYFPACLSAQGPPLSIPALDAFQLHLTPLNSTPTSLRMERPAVQRAHQARARRLAPRRRHRDGHGPRAQLPREPAQRRGGRHDVRVADMDGHDAEELLGVVDAAPLRRRAVHGADAWRGCVRRSSHRSPYDRVGVVNADP